MSTYFWIALGSALGGVLRYALTRGLASVSGTFPWSTILINVLGCFAIGFFGTFTLPGSRFAAPEQTRLFVMVGICGGFTTFSSFSLETFELLRNGSVFRAAANVVFSVLICLVSVAIGHHVAQRGNKMLTAVVVSRDEELAG